MSLLCNAPYQTDENLTTSTNSFGKCNTVPKVDNIYAVSFHHPVQLAIRRNNTIAFLG